MPTAYTDARARESPPATSPDDRGVTLIGIMVLFVLQVWLHWQIARRSFGLITKVPDRVVRWFGQGGENLKE